MTRRLSSVLFSVVALLAVPATLAAVSPTFTISPEFATVPINALGVGIIGNKTANQPHYFANGEYKIEHFVQNNFCVPNTQCFYQDGKSVGNDAASAQQICKYAGYASVVSTRGDDYTSCHNNQTALWRNGTWVTVNGCEFPNQMYSIVCSNPIVTPPPAPLSFTATKTRWENVTPEPGGRVIYTIVLRNNGATNAANIRLADNIPAGLTYLPGQSTPGCVQQGGTVFCNPLTYAPGQSVSFQLAFQIPVTQACNSVIDNVADIQQGTASFAWSNHHYTTVQCPQVPPQFIATKTRWEQVTPAPGGFLIYTVVMRNIGSQTSANIRLADNIPAGLTFVSWLSTPGCVQQGGTVFCNPMTYAPGQSVSFQLAFQIPSTQACNSVIDNVADIQQGTSSFAWSNHHYTTVQCPSFPVWQRFSF